MNDSREVVKQVSVWNELTMAEEIPSGPTLIFQSFIFESFPAVASA